MTHEVDGVREKKKKERERETERSERRKVNYKIS